MTVSARTLTSALAERVGRDRVLDGVETLTAFAIDGRTPRCVVRPQSLEQVAVVLALAWDEKLAVIPRGAGTTQTLGAPPARLDVVLDLTALDRVIEDNPDDLTIRVQAGLTAGALAQRLARRHQWLPVDPPAWRSRTLGGLVATGAAGPLRTRYGTLRDLVLGVRFVQAEGVVTWGGAGVVKSVTGYDVPKLIVGSLGTLGVVGELALRLQPMPDVERTWLATFGWVGAAQEFVSAVGASSLQPNRIELLNEAALRACEMVGGPVAVAVTIGSAAASVREQGERLQALAGAADASIAPFEGEFWTRYDAALMPAEGEVVLHIATLPSHLAETVAAVQGALPPEQDGAAMITGSPLIGTLRVALTGVEADTIKPLLGDVRAFVGALGGSVVVQSAPAAVRDRIDPWGPIDAGALSLMRAIKQEFDPRGVLNPGRFVGGL